VRVPRFLAGPPLGDVAIDEWLKASALLACCMYSSTHVKRHKRLDKTEVQTRQVFEIRTYGEKIKRQGREDNVELRRLNRRRKDSEINETNIAK